MTYDPTWTLTGLDELIDANGAGSPGSLATSRADFRHYYDLLPPPKRLSLDIIRSKEGIPNLMFRGMSFFQDTNVPEGEIHLVHEDGRVDKLVGLGGL